MLAAGVGLPAPPLAPTLGIEAASLGLGAVVVVTSLVALPVFATGEVAVGLLVELSVGVLTGLGVVPFPVAVDAAPVLVPLAVELTTLSAISSGEVSVQASGIKTRHMAGIVRVCIV